jgi:signal transduction histidine kinase
MSQHAQFSHVEFSILLTALSTFALAGLTFVLGRGRPLARSFSLYTLCICLWSSCYCLFLFSNGYEKGLFFMHLLSVPAAFIVPTFLFFVLKLTDKENERFWIKIKHATLAASTIFALLAFHRSYIPSLSPKAGFKFYIDPGPSYLIFNAWFVLSIGMCMFILLGSIRKSSKEKRVQLSYVLLAYAIGYGGGTTVFLPVYGIRQPAFAFYAVVIAHGLLFYSIIAHKLLNLQIFLRRAGLLSLIYGTLVVLTIPIVYYFRFHSGFPSNDITRFFYLNVFWLSALLSTGPFIYAYFIRKSMFFHDHAIAGLTHELKGPLAVIESALEAINLQASIKQTDAISQNNYLKIVSRNVIRLKDSVHHLLDLYTVQNTDRLTDVGIINLIALIKAVISRYSEFAAQTQNKIALSSVHTEIEIKCDPEKIDQIVSNLLNNALKYTRNGTVLIDIKQSTADIEITIKDTGRGIREKDLPQIFKRFYQGKNSAQGSGIGLTIAKAWVEAHGGKIWAESEGEGKGATVVFTLPAN